MSAGSEQARYVLDRWVARSAGGRILAGGAPSRLIRLSATGSAALDQMLAGRPAPAAEELRERLLETGMLHPLADAAGAPVSFVIPVRDGGEALPGLVESLRSIGEVIVVDDGSSDGSAEKARDAGARVLVNRRGPGPAGARNSGLAAARTAYVAFLDADCSCRSDWARPLAALLEVDPRLAVAAPRVRSAPGGTSIARYETVCSPLDLGADPGLVGPGRRIGYVPSAACVARRAALLELGGFDESLRVGEDVDLILRAVEAGWSIRYAPESEVIHRPRASFRALARQRFAYGRSAARLDRLHPGAVSPLRVNSHFAAVWSVAACFGPAAALAAATGSVLATASRGRDRQARLALARLALRGHLHASHHLGRALARDWLPLTVGASLLSRRARRLALLAIAADALSALSRSRSQPLLPQIALRGIDNLAYGAGLWRGALAEQSLGALAPRLNRE